MRRKTSFDADSKQGFNLMVQKSQIWHESYDMFNANTYNALERFNLPFKTR